MTLAEWKDIATIAGIIVALLTYMTNSYFQFRNKRIENLQRYFEAHDKLYQDGGFIMSNIKEFEAGTYKRDTNDSDMEKKFNRFLGDIEKIAFLTSHGAVPTNVQVYLFGWFAQKIHPIINKEERENIFWELAVHYIDEVKKSADDYSKYSTEDREKYLKKKSLDYKRYTR